MSKRVYDLILTVRGVQPMKEGYHEHVAGLSMVPYDPANYIIHESPRAIYRIHVHDINDAEIQRYLAQADAMSPEEADR